MDRPNTMCSTFSRDAAIPRSRARASHRRAAPPHGYVSTPNTSSSPAPHQTLDLVREEVPALAQLPRLDVPGLMERDYGRFDGKPVEQLPADPWNPGDATVRYGGESQAAARYRIVRTMQDLMNSCEGNVLAVSHGSISRLFKTVWAEHARCDQDVALGNCCVLVFEYDSATGTFANTEILNQ